MLENLMNIDGPPPQWPVVGKHIHLIEKIANAVGLRLDQLRELAVIGAERRLEQLCGTANARQGILDLMRQRCSKSLHRPDPGTLGELLVELLRNRPGVDGQKNDTRQI